MEDLVPGLHSRQGDAYAGKRAWTGGGGVNIDIGQLAPGGPQSAIQRGQKPGGIVLSRVVDGQGYYRLIVDDRDAAPRVAGINGKYQHSKSLPQAGVTMKIARNGLKMNGMSERVAQLKRGEKLKAQISGANGGKTIAEQLRCQIGT